MGLISSKISELCEYIRYKNSSHQDNSNLNIYRYKNLPLELQQVTTPVKNAKNVEKNFEVRTTISKKEISTTEDDFNNKISLKDLRSEHYFYLHSARSRNKTSKFELSKSNTYPYYRADSLKNPDILESHKITKTGIKLDDFEILKVLGRGSFGKVLLVKHKKNLNYYAMKVLKKERLFKTNQISHTKTEKEILQKIDHPFLVKLHYAFQNDVKLYLVTEFVQGGELFFHLKRDRKFNEKIVRIYACEIILALEYLHKNNIIYRDLKPENILLNGDGHIQLTDFGLSKFLNGRKATSNFSVDSFNSSDLTAEKAYTICGTPEYLAPEILVGRGYDKSVDWWSLGVLLFEMLTGGTPFKYKKEKRIDHNMYMRPVDIKNNKELSEDAKHLIQSFLKFDPSERLNNPQLIKSHPFFKGINWDHITYKLYPVEFVPNNYFKSKEDLCFFDKKYVEDSFSSDEEVKKFYSRKNHTDYKFNDRKFRRYNDFNNFSFEREDS
jgi:serine/threonine protein kinase